MSFCIFFCNFVSSNPRVFFSAAFLKLDASIGTQLIGKWKGDSFEISLEGREPFLALGIWDVNEDNMVRVIWA